MLAVSGDETLTLQVISRNGQRNEFLFSFGRYEIMLRNLHTWDKSILYSFKSQVHFLLRVATDPAKHVT
jgi:hypothetical protein